MHDHDDRFEFDGARARSGLIEGLRASRDAERQVLDALDPADRDALAPDGGWSAKDVQAHLAAWRGRIAGVLAARREGRPDPRDPDRTVDEINAGLHADRRDWPWDRVRADAEATTEALVAEVTAASDETLADPNLFGSILGDGPEHDLGHLAGLAAKVGLDSLVLGLADTTLATVDGGGWPPGSAAGARYNLACFHALAGNLDVARSLLRQALPARTDLRELAPVDDDLIALRAEIPELAAG